MKAKPLLEIVREYLSNNFYDGLYNDDCECACTRDDLSPGDCIAADCTAGVYHPNQSGYEFRIGEPHNGWIAE